MQAGRQMVGRCACALARLPPAAGALARGMPPFSRFSRRYFPPIAADESRKEKVAKVRVLPWRPPAYLGVLLPAEEQTSAAARQRQDLEQQA